MYIWLKLHFHAVHSMPFSLPLSVCCAPVQCLLSSVRWLSGINWKTESWPTELWEKDDPCTPAAHNRTMSIAPRSLAGDGQERATGGYKEHMPPSNSKPFRKWTNAHCTQKGLSFYADRWVLYANGAVTDNAVFFVAQIISNAIYYYVHVQIYIWQPLWNGARQQRAFVLAISNVAIATYSEISIGGMRFH